MWKSLFAGTCLLAASASSFAYDTGSLSCERIGELAAKTLAAKQSGAPANASLTALTDQFAPEALTERKLVSNINRIIYTNDLIVAMKPGDAYLIFMHDCMSGRDWDRTN